MVKQLKDTDTQLVNAICESLKTAYDPAISKFFAHHDLGYKRFFNAVVNKPDYYTYYCYDPTHHLLQGFAFFQRVGDILFLKNIVVDNRLRGSKIGTSLLRFAVKDIQMRLAEKLRAFQLDVFEKNTKALSWYLSIGMKILGCTYWYDVTAQAKRAVLKEMEDNHFEVSYDDFGFKQVKFNDERVGTLMATNAFVIRSEKIAEILRKIPPFIKQQKIKTVGFVSDHEYEYKLVDRAFRMEIPLTELYLN